MIEESVAPFVDRSQSAAHLEFVVKGASRLGQEVPFAGSDEEVEVRLGRVNASTIRMMMEGQEELLQRNDIQ